MLPSRLRPASAFCRAGADQVAFHAPAGRERSVSCLSARCCDGLHNHGCLNPDDLFVCLGWFCQPFRQPCAYNKLHRMIDHNWDKYWPNNRRGK